MSLRTLSRARLTGLALATAGATLAGAAAPAAAVPVSLELDYQCSFPLLKPQPVKLKITTDIPSQVDVGKFTGAFDVSAVATVSAESTKGLRALETETIEGSAVALTDVIQPNGQTLVARIPTTVTKRSLPASGGFDTNATGSTPSLVFQQAGTVRLNVRDLILTLTPRLADGTLTGLDTFETECFQVPGQNNTLATIAIVNPGTATPTPTPTPTSTPTPTPSPTPAPGGARNWSVNGLAYLKNIAKGTVRLTGNAATTRDASGAVTGSVALDPARADLRALSLLPLKASFVFTSVGDATGTLTGNTLSLTTRQDIRLTNVSVFGVNLISGNCRTSAPATLAFKSNNGAFSPDTGGTALSQFAIPSFTNCGVLGSFIAGLTAGPGNAMTLTFAPKSAA